MASVVAFVSSGSGASATHCAVRLAVLDVGMAQKHDEHERVAQKSVAVVWRLVAATVVTVQMNRQTEELRVMRSNRCVHRRQCCLCLGDVCGFASEIADLAKATMQTVAYDVLPTARMQAEAGFGEGAYQIYELQMGLLQSELPHWVLSLQMPVSA